MPTTAHALLRDRLHWRGELRGLAIARNGDLELARAPAPADGKRVEIPVSYPYVREISGLAIGPCDAIFIANTAHDRIGYIDTQCGTQSWLPAVTHPAHDTPGSLAAPRGLAVGADGVWVADHGHHRLQHLAFPRLEPNLSSNVLASPTAIALDAHGRLLAVDGATGCLQRILRDGALDRAFAATQHDRPLRAAHCVAVYASGAILVSDTHTNEVLVLDQDGRMLRTLDGPAGWLPGALAAHGTLAYVADAASGAILMFEGESLQGPVEGWRGPVTALAVGGNGDLYVKPGLDARYVRFTMQAAHRSYGSLHAGPFDAGEDQVWERAWIDVEVPAGGRVDLEIALTQAPAVPDTGAWHTLPSSDALLSQIPGGSDRFAWLRLRLHSASAQASPVVKQVRLATAAEDYLDYLPLTYRRNDHDGFLSRWLTLLHGEFARIEDALDVLPRLADPDFVPSASIAWLAQWFAMELPVIADDAQRRALIHRALSLTARRGTSASIAQFVEMHTGIRPAIVEAFDQRRMLILGVSSRLDFDTRLPSMEAMGMVVPDAAAGACCPGPIGSAVVGASGPLAPHQLGLPLFADEAHRFCVVVDAYRVTGAGVMDELNRIVEREKPAHTDYRIEVVAPELRIGLQARIGIDAIVGEQPSAGLGDARLGIDALLAADDAARVGATNLDGTLILS